MSVGIFPLRLFDLRLRISRASSFPMVPDGIGPTSPIPGRWTATTRVPWVLQVIPAQEVQIGEATFQLSFRLCGTLAAKLRRACLSEFKSAQMRGRIATWRRKTESSKEDLRFMVDFSADAILR